MSLSVITEKNPALILFLLDRSGSMAEKIEYQGVLRPRSAVVASIINSTISELVMRCRKGDDYKDYFDVAAFGYSDSSLYSLLDYVSENRVFFSVNDLLRSDVGTSFEYPSRISSHGDMTTFRVRRQNWVEEGSLGATPTFLSLMEVCKYVKDWCNVCKDSCSPFVIHITDGSSTDSTPEMLMDAAKRLKKISTNKGNVIFLNVHLSSSSGGILFPSSKEELVTSNRYSSLLYDMSSDMPREYSEEIAYLKELDSLEELPVFRAFAYNSTISDLLSVLNIGISSIG